MYPPPPNIKNSLAEITYLSLTVNGNDYVVGIRGIEASVLIPMNKTVPDQVTVKNVTLSKGANGLRGNDRLTLTNGSTQVTITAEDATKLTYTITVAKRFTVAEVAKSNTGDIRWSYVLFTIKSGDRSVLGRHKLALKLKTADKPTIREMTNGAGIYRIINGTEKRMLLAYTLESTIGDTLATGSPYLGRLVKHGDAEDPNDASNTDTLEVNSLLLTTGQTYTLYALKDGGTEVEALGNFSTDAFDDQATVTKDTILDPALTGKYPLDVTDEVFVFPIPYSLNTTTLFNYIVESLKTPDTAYLRPLLFSFNNGVLIPASIDVYPKVMCLIPSRFTTTTKPTVNVGGIETINWILIFSPELATNRMFRFMDQGTHKLYSTITTVTDE